MPKSSRIIWGKWDCSSCGEKGISAEPPPGEVQPKCPHCGNPRETGGTAGGGKAGGEKAYLDNARDSAGRVSGANVADTAEEVAIATAGADWTCARCGGDNRAGKAQCQGCGASRAEALAAPGAAGGSGGGAGRATEGPTAQAVEREPDESGVGWLDRVPGGWLGVLALGVLFPGVALGIGSVWYQMGYREDVAGAVSGVHWSQRVEVQAYAPVVSGGWQDGLYASDAVMPVDGDGESPGVANIRDCAMRHHHDERYECGTERVCEQRSRQVSDGEDCHEVCNTTDNGNGSFTENCDDVCSPTSHSESYEECHDQTKYCERPVEAEWCTFDSWQWTSVQTVELHGGDVGDGALPWPTPPTGALQRAVRSGDYSVDYAIPVNGEIVRRSEPVPNEEALVRWHVGDKVVATLDYDGAISAIRRPPAHPTE